MKFFKLCDVVNVDRYCLQYIKGDLLWIDPRGEVGTCADINNEKKSIDMVTTSTPSNLSFIEHVGIDRGVENAMNIKELSFSIFNLSLT